MNNLIKFTPQKISNELIKKDSRITKSDDSLFVPFTEKYHLLQH